jgi:hypothetical protein
MVSLSRWPCCFLVQAPPLRFVQFWQPAADLASEVMYDCWVFGESLPRYLFIWLLFLVQLQMTQQWCWQWIMPMDEYAWASQMHALQMELYLQHDIGSALDILWSNYHIWSNCLQRLAILILLFWILALAMISILSRDLKYSSRSIFTHNIQLSSLK